MSRTDAFTDDEALWFPAHMSTGDSFSRPTGVDGGHEGASEDGIGLPGRRRTTNGGPPKKGYGGVKVSSWLWLTLWGVAAIGIVTVSARKEIAAEIAQSWLKGQGVPAKLTLDKLSFSHVSGHVILGNADNPEVSINSFEADYSLNLFAGGSSLARLKTLRLIHPVVKMSFTKGQLNFGSLDHLVQSALNAKPDKNAPAPDVVIEDGTLRLTTDYGLVRAHGGLSLHDGALTFLTLTTPASHLHGPMGEGDFAPGQVTAKTVQTANGDQLHVLARVGAENWDVKSDYANPLESVDADHQKIHLQNVTLDLDTLLPYRHSKSMAEAFSGVAEATLGLRIEGLQSQAVYISGLEANLHIAGQLKTSDSGMSYEGPARLLARADSLTTGDTDTQSIKIVAPGLGLRAGFDAKSGIDLALSGAMSGEVGLLRQNTLFSKNARLHVDSLALNASATGAHAEFNGGLDLERLSFADLGLDGLTASLAGQAQSDESGAWQVLVKSNLASDNGRYEGLKALAQGRAPARKAPVNGPVDSVVALDRAFDRFGLRAPGVSMSFTGAAKPETGLTPPPQFDIRVDRPITASLKGGGALTITPLVGKPLLASGKSGAFNLTLIGAGLPDVALGVADLGFDPQNPFIIHGGYRLAAGFDFDPVSGARIDGHGRFTTTSDNAFLVTLDDTAIFTAKSAELGDHLEGLAATITQGSKPFLRSDINGWHVSGTFENLSLLAPNEAVHFGNAQGLFDGYSIPGSDTPGLKVTLSGSGLSDAGPTDQTRFNPLVISGSLNQDPKALSGRFTAATPAQKQPNGTLLPIAAITLDNDIATGKGKLAVHTLDLTFGPEGLQPVELSPVVATVLSKDVSGKASFDGAFTWDKAQVLSGGDLKIDGLNFTGATGVSQGLHGLIHFTSLAPLTSDPGQFVGIDSLQVGLPLTHMALSVQFRGDHLALESAQVESPGGLVHLEPTTIPFDAKSSISGAVAFNGLDFGKIIAATDLATSMSFEGNLSGRLPFTIAGGRIRFAQGIMGSDAPGKIAIRRTGVTDMTATGTVSSPDTNSAPAAAPVATFNPFQDLAFQAMEHISYDKIDAKLNSTDDGKLDINFHIKGFFDPPQKQKANISLFDYISGAWMQKPIKLPSNTPVELYLDIPVNLDEILSDLTAFNASAKTASNAQ